jgi:hypothetical protein
VFHAVSPVGLARNKQSEKAPDTLMQIKPDSSRFDRGASLRDGEPTIFAL